ncbi:hypothetical protein EIN_033930 [Entamoeba invadens IP1]|uniref:Ras-GEF domain-containing protein n=1 Tax=Entamoeba invadens IP1 TaxID=370355 RepID=A0A0A1TY95_ENTIV|nr:hypothetical protein EIN_033930 [Entamoeba invadens IP1]ELP86492.1 hypothetical protein EIN_033930 [Entamoeba invadens IP1]|eukprot:XP_004185838.1 hypothetical protein EIN_033930 [Entamoeba invadens IP1]
MTLTQLRQTMSDLKISQEAKLDTYNCFLNEYKSDENKQNKTVLVQTDSRKIFLVDGISSVIETLERLPFSRVMWCSLVFYPIDWREDKLFECLSARLLNNPNNEVLLLALQTWVEECGPEFTSKSLDLFKELLSSIESRIDEKTKVVFSKVKETITTTKSNETEPTFQMIFNPAKLTINGRSVTLPQWARTTVFSANILNKDFLDIASQLMICEHTFLSKLQPKDFYLYTFPTSREESNIKVYLKWSALVSNWVAFALINQQNEMIREIAFKNFLQLALKCLEIRNFNSFNSVVTGLLHFANSIMVTSISQRTPDEVKLLDQLVILQAKVLHSDYSLLFDKPSIPCIKYFLGQINKIYSEVDEIDDTTGSIPSEEELSKMFDASKAFLIGDIIYSIRNVTGHLEIKPNEQMKEFFLSTLRTMKLANDELLELAKASEKRDKEKQVGKVNPI